MWICKGNEDVDLDKYNYGGCNIEFSFRDGSLGKMSLFLELRWAYLCILIIKIKIS